MTTKYEYDGTFQKFTGQKRDNETGLDYFGARYMSAPQGRFMSPDLLGGNIYDPQTLNKYSYVRNNPLRFTDPTGMYICENDDGDTVECSAEDFANFEKSRQKGLKTNNKDIIRAMEAYGDPNIDNGVRLRIGDPGGGDTGNIRFDWDNNVDTPNGMRANLLITIRGGLNENDLMAAAAHEGVHAADAQDFIKSITADGPNNRLNLTRYDRERNAFLVEHTVHLNNNQMRSFDCGSQQCRFGVGAANIERQIQNHLSSSYSVSPKSPGPLMYPSFAPKVTVPQR